MSSNFSNFDFLFNVEQGKKLTQAQLVANYKSMMEQANGETASIFGSDMQGFIGEMFEIMNTNKAADGEEEFLDEEEIAALRSYVNDGDDNSKVSSNDLNELFRLAIEKINNKYSSDVTATPEGMYQQAVQAANGDMRDSSYIQNLSYDIDALVSMMSLRQSNSDDIINQYEDKIEDLIQKSTKLSKKFKSDYAKAKKEAAQQQKLMSEAQAKIQKNQQEIDSINQEQAIIQKQLDSMSDEEKEKNAELIEQRNSEISDFNTRKSSLIRENQKLFSNILTYSKNLNKARQQMSKMQKEATESDSSIREEIAICQAQIREEKANCKNDIDNYNSRLENIRAAREYAIQNISYTVDNQANSFASHNNDGAISFDELQAQGLKYSSEKGQKLASDVYSHRVGFTGWCARHVADGLKRTGLGNERANATDMDDKLMNNSNYRAVKISSKEQLRSLPAGCIVVYEAGAAGYHSVYGHIEVTMGDGTAVSDGVTRNMKYADNMTVFVPVEQA